MEGWLEPALRFLHYAALLGLFGWTTFRLIGLRSVDWLPQDTSGAKWIGVATAAPLLSLVLMLTSIASMMGVPPTALDWPLVEAMVSGTDIGTAFLVRTSLLVIGLAALLLRQRTAAALPLASACFAGVLMTLGWSGHAAATEGGLGLFHRLNDGVHLLAAGLWLGAIGWFLHLTRLAHRDTQIVPAQPLLVVMHCFAPLGVALVATVGITGLINAQLIFGLQNSGTVLSTSHGLLLAAKIALVTLMLAFGAHNARIGLRYATMQATQADDREASLAALGQTLAKEMLTGIVVIGLVAVLGMLSPMVM